MSIIRIPTPLRNFTGGLAEIETDAATVSGALHGLERLHPGISERILDGTRVHRFVNVYVEDEDIRFLDGLETRLEPRSVISIVSAIAGGAVGMPLSSDEAARYARQLRIAGFGESGQQRLKDATVMISRCGGVGGTAAINLAIAGVGKLVLAHGGDVVPDYLNRWVWAGPQDIGQPCVEVLARHIAKLNPNVEIVSRAAQVSESNVEELVKSADLVIDGAPLFEERYLMHAEAVKQRKPLVMGAMYSTEGYVTTVVPGETPCLKCLYPSKPDYWTNIQVFPAIGPGPIIVGSMCAMEAIKVVSGFGKPLKNALWRFDLENCFVQTLKIRRRPDCEFCGGLGRAS
jgi:molybdopterin/thiamine biosynthesis adenylyltransferase/molybdopterin converting factor small subunit